MITPYIVEEMFEPNFNEPTYCDNYIIIDDYLKNYDQIYEMTSNSYAASWRNGGDNKNFKDYYQCTYDITDYHPDSIRRDKRKRYIEGVMNGKWKDISEIFLNGLCCTGNVFRLIKPNIENYQHGVHTDSHYNMIIYIDKESIGGTAIYDRVVDDGTPHSTRKPAREDNLPIDIIQAKPNRCVIFDGEMPHGAWSEGDEAYKDIWRMDYTSFIKVDKFTLSGRKL